MEKKELWYEMLTTYRCLMRFENGITLPNMIGAYHLYDSSIDLSSSQCVISVLNDILSSPRNVGVLINKCDNIHNYILSITDRSLNNPNISDKIFVGLYDSNLQTVLSSVNELGEYLYSLYREEIINKKFSVTDGVWNPLSDIEIGHINDIIKSL